MHWKTYGYVSTCACTQAIPPRITHACIKMTLFTVRQLQARSSTRFSCKTPAWLTRLKPEKFVCTYHWISALKDDNRLILIRISLGPDLHVLCSGFVPVGQILFHYRLHQFYCNWARIFLSEFTIQIKRLKYQTPQSDSRPGETSYRMIHPRLGLIHHTKSDARFSLQMFRQQEEVHLCDSMDWVINRLVL